MIRALLVDDESPARRRIRDLLNGVDDVRLVGECSDGVSALECLEREEVDLLFLDVQMPEMDGLEMLGLIPADRRPAVIFVTAFDEHAVAAFDARALDYLLKPFTEARFRDALSRARERLSARTGAADPSLQALVDERAARRRLVVRQGGRIHFVDLEGIRWLEADGNYVRVHTTGEVYRTRATLRATLERLPPGFLRIHQSYVVNAARIRELEPWTHGEFAVVLDDGTALVSSRTYSAELRRLLDG